MASDKMKSKSHCLYLNAMRSELSNFIKDGWEKKEQILSNLDYEFRTLKYFRDTVEAETMRATV